MPEDAEIITSGFSSKAVVNSAIFALISSVVYSVQMALISAGVMFIFLLFIARDWGCSHVHFRQKAVNGSHIVSVKSALSNQDNGRFEPLQNSVCQNC